MMVSWFAVVVDLTLLTAVYFSVSWACGSQFNYERAVLHYVKSAAMLKATKNDS